jgi:hypothetical protein
VKIDQFIERFRELKPEYQQRIEERGNLELILDSGLPSRPGVQNKRTSAIPLLMSSRQVAREIYGLRDPAAIRNKTIALTRQCREGLVPPWAYLRKGTRYEFRLDYFMGEGAPGPAADRDPVPDRIPDRLKAFVN